MASGSVWGLRLTLRGSGLTVYVLALGVQLLRAFAGSHAFRVQDDAVEADVSAIPEVGVVGLDVDLPRARSPRRPKDVTYQLLEKNVYSTTENDEHPPPRP